jgi:phosphoglycolate phosphatase-like HAD superfamily hydrolase
MPSFAKSRTLIIFDVDGTLVDAHEVDNASFNDAFQEITGMAMTESLWSSFTEVTSQATIHQALGKHRSENLSLIKNGVRDSFLARLRTGHNRNPTSIRAFEGAIGLISTLKKRSDFGVAIATGCWRETSHFKLNAAGFDLSDVPFACASDCYSRAEIISLAAERAGMSLEHAVYVGDGLWDFRATQQLGIPFIGFGRRIEALRQAGVQHTLDDWNEDALLKLLDQFPERGSRTDLSTSSG